MWVASGSEHSTDTPSRSPVPNFGGDEVQRAGASKPPGLGALPVGAFDATAIGPHRVGTKSGCAQHGSGARLARQADQDSIRKLMSCAWQGKGPAHRRGPFALRSPTRLLTSPGWLGPSPDAIDDRPTSPTWPDARITPYSLTLHRVSSPVVSGRQRSSRGLSADSSRTRRSFTDAEVEPREAAVQRCPSVGPRPVSMQRHPPGRPQAHRRRRPRSPRRAR